MAVIKKLALSDLRPGMIVTKTDKAGIKFPYYGTPLPNLEPISVLRDNGVEHVFVRIIDGQQLADEEEIIDTSELQESIQKGHDIPVVDVDDDDTPPSPRKEELYSHADISVHAQRLDEIEHLKRFYDRARESTKDILEKFKFSGTIDIRQCLSVVNELTSIQADTPTIAITLSQMKGMSDYMYEHSLNVCILSIALAKRMKFTPDELKITGLVGLLHDAGMMQIPMNIINKPGKLTTREYEFIKKHPQTGYELLKRNKSIPQSVLAGVLQHHERVDGNGYPNSLSDKQIVKYAKVVAIVDAFDAMTSDRIYTPGMPPAQALKFIFNNAGTHYDEAMVKFFVNMVGIYPVGTLVMLDTGELAIVYQISRENLTRPKVLIITDEKRKSAVPFLYDLTSYHSVSNKYYKKILSPINPKLFRCDVKQVIKEFLEQSASPES